MRSWISDAVTSTRPEPVRAETLPGGGRLLTAGRDGLFVRTSHGPRRIFGDVGEAAWSPRGLFVVVTRGIELIAVSPRGERRWSLHQRAPIRHPRWAPSGYQIAYLSGGGVHLVDGDGSNDARLGPADGAAPAWRRARGHSQVAYARGRTVVLRDTIDRRILFATHLARRPLALSWSSDAERLLVVERDRIQVLDKFGAVLRTSRAPRGTQNVTGTFAPASRDWTLVRVQGASSRLMLVSGRDTLKVLELAGRVDGITFSPSGRWLALGVGPLGLAGAPRLPRGAARRPHRARPRAPDGLGPLMPAIVVVGAGAAGCVVAARVARRTSRSVLLLEAGPDLREAVPASCATAGGSRSNRGGATSPSPMRAARSAAPFAGGSSAAVGG